MTEQELLDSINKTIVGLEEHIVCDGCYEDYTLGCLSCTTIRLIQDLKDLVELIR